MSVGSLVHYFETLNVSMDPKRERLPKKGANRSVPERNGRTVKQFISEITELKRPNPKNKIVQDSTTEKSNTVPRVAKYKKTQSKLKNSATFKASETRKDYTNSSSSSYSNKFDSSIDNGVESFHQKIQILSEQTQDIARRVEEFGENLKQKRSQLQNEQSEVFALPKSIYKGVIDTSSTSSLITDEEDEEESSLALPEYINTNDSIPREQDEEKFPLSKPNYIQSKDSISGEEKFPVPKPEHIQPKDSIPDEVDGGESSDDMFGHNSFEENEDDNYVLEAYNRLGHELVMTTLLITRHTITHNEIDANVTKLIHTSDFVVHKNVCDSSDSESNEAQTDFKITENEKTQDPNRAPFLYNNYFYNDAEEDDEVFHDETASEQYMSRFINYDSKDNNSREENEPFYQNISNFSVLHEAIGEQDDHLGKISSANAEKRKKIDYVIEEMIKTEELYIKGLEMVTKDYMPYINTHRPPDLLGRTSYLFGNIEAIYDNAKKFLNLMKNNCEDADSLAQVFINSASKFELYPLYSKNKPTADLYIKQFDSVIKERQVQLNDKLGLASYLLTPIQRLGKYVLLLEHIQKELKKDNKSTEKVSAAISVVRSVMRKGNDFIAIDSIKDSAVDLTTKGSFIMRALFNILKPRKFVSMVFLFENIIVFTEKTTKNLEHFRYVDSIQMSDLSLGKFEEKPNIFHLTNYTKSKKNNPEATYVLEAETPKVKDDWTDRIETILWRQLEKAKELQKKLKTSDEKHRAKSRPANNPKVTLRTTKSYRPAAKSKSKFYDDRTP